MAGYDYTRLSPLDFERLCCAILSKLEGKRFQRFGEGRDGGVDLQYDGGAGDLRVYQCKRYRHTANLMSVLRKDEVGKVQRLKPNTYGIITSAPLTTQNKDEIVSVFRPYLRSSQYVLGPTEIDDLLEKKEFSDIVRNISALWLPSFSIVSSIINNGILGRTEHDLGVLMKECTRWTWTEATRKGEESLKKHHIAIFIGDPGVGKTVSAKLLLCQSCLEGFQPVITYDKIEDLESVYEPGKKQVFFFDDFLGQNYFEAISDRADTKVCRFIERIRANPDKRFLLTSRTTILNRGYECSVTFRLSEFNKRAYLINTNTLTEEDRARVLYMNLYHADCSLEELGSVLKNKNYRKVLRHENFSPRIVGYILEARTHRQELGGDSLYDCLLKALNDPKEVWKTVYDNQLNPLERVLLWCVFLSTRLDEGALNDCFDALKGTMAASTSTWGSLTFDQTAKSLTGALLVRMRSESSVRYELLNPSIADFLISNWQGDALSVKLALAVLRSRAAAVKFFDFASKTVGAERRFNNVVHYLATLASPEGAGPDLALVANRELLSRDPKEAQGVWGRIKTIPISKLQRFSVDDWAIIMSMLEGCGMELSSVINEIKPEMRSALMDLCGEFKAAATLWCLFSQNGGFVPVNSSSVLTSALATEAYDYANSMTMPELELKDNGKMGLRDYDYERMESEIKDHVLSQAMHSKIPTSLIDIKLCLDNVDLNEMFECDPDDYYGENGGEEGLGDVSDIDSLFEGLLADPK